MLLTLKTPQKPNKDPKTPYFLPNYAQTALGLEQKLSANEGGRAGFIERRARLAWHHATRRVMMPREPCSCHVAILSFHASTSPNLPRFSRAYPFLTQFSRAVLEVFRNSKWVMQHIAGKLLTSSSQRYKVYTNRSSDERVMALGSRGAGAVFVRFSSEDSSQTGKAIGEPRVARRSWSRHLDNVPLRARQVAASRQDSAHEGGCPGGKTCFLPSAFFLKSCPSSRILLT